MKTRLITISGCMFSGKTTELLSRAKNHRNKENFFAFSPDIDDRYKRGHISSHNGESLPCTLIDSDEPEEILEEVDPNSRIFIDEGNLFSNSLASVVRELALDNRIVVSALDLDYLGRPFSPVPRILSLSDEVHKKHATCEKCNNKANRTQRIVNGSPASESDPLILVGGEETYEPRCRECHIVPSSD